MPAPLGTTPTRKMPKIDVYGLADSSATRNAIRFFRERRIVVRFIDLRKQPLTAAELRPFAEGLGLEALVDSGGTAPAAPARATRATATVAPATDVPASVGGLVASARADPRILRLPLVRYGDRMTSGKHEETWALWLAPR